LPLAPAHHSVCLRTRKPSRQKLKSAIIATVIWFALMGGLYACSEWLLTPEPAELFATEAECSRALGPLHGRGVVAWCTEIEKGGWCAEAYDGRLGTDSCFTP
jgi:hypothetical protein